MLKKFLSLSAVLCVCCVLNAQTIIEKTDTSSVKIRDYLNELGYFQKANVDASDPRFMFHDQKSGFDLGVGGEIEVASFVGPDGGLPSAKFNPRQIAVPTEHQFYYGAKISGSSINVKARSHIGKHKLIAYVKLCGSENNMVKMDRAYASFDGFSIGLIPSFFEDLEAGVKKKLSVGQQSGVAHTLVGYTHRFFNQSFEVAGAFEIAGVDLSGYGFQSYLTNYQPTPDVTAHLKYRFDRGHIQLGGVFRWMSYWVTDNPEDVNLGGWAGKTTGYGLALSGNFKPTNNFKIVYYVNGGKGIARYMDYLDGLNIDLAITDVKHDKYNTMDSCPVGSASLALQYDFSKFNVSAIGGYARLFRNPEYTYSNSFEQLAFASANFFWNISDFAMIGGVYCFGYRKDYVLNPTTSLYGTAQRISVLLSYVF